MYRDVTGTTTWRFRAVSATTSTASLGREKRVRALKDQLPWVVLTALVLVLVLLAVVPLQTKAFENGAAGLGDLTEMEGLGAVVRNTLLLGVGAMAVGMVLGATVALSVYAMPRRLQSVLGFTPVLPIIIPSVAHVVGFVFLFSPENGYANVLLRMLPFIDDGSGPVNVYTPLWIIIYTGLHLSAFVYLFVYSGLKNLGTDYSRAARVNGAGTLRVLFTVTLPMLRPVFVYAGMVTFLLSLGQFTGPLILGRREGLDVITTRMFLLTSDYPVNYGLAAALGTPLLVLAFVLIFIQRRMSGDQRRFVGRGAESIEQAPVSRMTSVLATLYVLMFVTLSAVLPLIALAYVSLSPFWTGNLSLDALTLANFETLLADPRLTDAITTSLVITGLGVVIVMPIGLLVALALTNRDRIWRPLAVVLDVAASLPLAVPAALVGFGFLFAFTSPAINLYGTRTALVIGYVTIMLPYAVRYQLATLISLGQQTMEASRVAGAGPFRTFFQIVLPLARGGMAASAAIMFVLLIHEFGVSLLLRSPDSTVMSVLLYDQFSTGSYPQVAVTAIVMTALTSAGVIAALLFGGTRAMERL
jgi:iron(III) transport system permease protein